MRKKRVFIGVDIGKKGAIVAIHENGLVNKHTIPVIGDKVLDTELFKIFEEYQEYEVFVCLEEVHSLFGMSAKSNFSFGELYGKKKMIGAVCSYLYGFTLDFVPPKKWQAQMWTTTDKVFKTGKKVDTKKTSLVAANRLLPGEAFLATTRSRVAHDGLVDAYLIAMYCKLKYA